MQKTDRELVRCNKELNDCLIIIGHARIDVNSEITSHRGTNEIVKSYKKHFNKILYIGTANTDIEIFETKLEGIQACALKFNRSKSGQLRYLLDYFRHSARIKKIINDYTPDIIQLRVPSLFTFLRYLDFRSIKTPISTYIAGDWYESHTKNNDYFGVSMIAKIFDVYQNNIIRNTIPVVAGQELKNKYVSLNDCHAYMSTTHNRIYKKDNVKFSGRLAIIGNLNHLKRVEDAIYALSSLIEKNSSFKLNIIGDGSIKSDLIDLVKILKIEDNVTFVGYVNDSKDMDKIYMDHDVLLHPSISEGTPKVIAEAMAHGVVPIAVNGIGSINHIIEHKKNGFLVQRENPDEIAQFVMKLQEEPETYSSMVQNAYRYALDHTLDKEVKKKWKFIREKIALSRSIK